MLPDFPKAKKTFNKKLMERFDNRVKQNVAPFNQSPIKPMLEGHRMRIERSDGSVDDKDISQFEAPLEIDYKDVEELAIEEILKKIDDAADEMGRQLSNHLYREICRITEQANNLIKGKGEPFSIEKYFELLEKIEIYFNPNGDFELPTILAGKDLLEKIKRILHDAKTGILL